MTVMKQEVYTHRSLETGEMPHHTGLHEEAPGSVRRQKEQTEMYEPSPWFLNEVKVKQAENWLI